jgi:hypothetical protein
MHPIGFVLFFIKKMQELGQCHEELDKKIH